MKETHVLVWQFVFLSFVCSNIVVGFCFVFLPPQNDSSRKTEAARHVGGLTIELSLTYA